MKKYNLLTPEEYKQKKHRIPYFFAINNGKQRLYYIGTRHTYNINHPQYSFIKYKFEEFLTDTDNSNLIIAETRVYSKCNTPEEAVTESGDAGYVHYLSNEHNVEIAYVEPEKAEELEYLQKKYNREQIIYYHFSRIVSQFIRSREDFTKKEFEVYAKKFLSKYKKQFNWDDCDFSLTNMYKIHKVIFKKEFDLNDKDFLRKIPWPIVNFSEINDIARDSDYFRNNHIVEQIEKYWNEGKNLFIAYGSSHAVIQEPAIKRFVKE